MDDSTGSYINESQARNRLSSRSKIAIIIFNVIVVSAAIGVFRKISSDCIYTLYSRRLIVNDITIRMVFSCFILFLMIMWLLFSCKMKGAVKRMPFIILLAMLANFAVSGFMAFHYSPLKNSYIDRGGGVYSYKPQGHFIESKNIGGEKKTFIYEFDSEGHRYCPYSTGEHSNKILLVGDSFIFGEYINTEDTLCARLGDALKKQGYKDFSIKNLGMFSLALHSYVNVAKKYLATDKAGWIIIGYLSDNDLQSFDTSDSIRLTSSSPTYDFISSIFGGPEVVSLFYTWMAAYRVNGERNKYRLFASDADELKKMAERTRIIIITYRKDDEFIDFIDRNVKEIHIVRLDMFPYRHDGVSELEVPGDVHPSGKCNMILADRIAGYISGH